jgi:hypothetical protein
MICDIYHLIIERMAASLITMFHLCKSTRRVKFFTSMHSIYIFTALSILHNLSVQCPTSRVNVAVTCLRVELQDS